MDNENKKTDEEIIAADEEKADTASGVEEVTDAAVTDAAEETAGNEVDTDTADTFPEPAQNEPADMTPAVEPVAVQQPVLQVKESKREKRAREKEQARLEKEMAKQRAREEKAAARAAKKAEIRYRNIPTVIILSLIIAVLTAGLGFLGWEYIGSLSTIDSITAEKARLNAQIEDLGEALEEKEAQINDQLSQIENKNSLISDSDAAAKAFSEKVTVLEGQIDAIRNEAGEILDVISGREPLGVAHSGDFYADRAVVIIENGESFPLNISALYGEKKTAINYSFDDSTKNIDSISLSQESITGRSGLISVKVKKKTAEESGVAVLKFENDHSDDFFYIIVIVK
ncbi:MAG: hypothetical protein IJJ22_02665 [Oscillospiraceae bacterium]|nr:hypothetical protein [Oscillospiraceae bacterium]